MSVVVAARGELFATADYRVLAATLTPETHRLAGASELARMKPSAVLINIGRCGLVDDPALIDVLQRRRSAARRSTSSPPSRFLRGIRPSRWTTCCSLRIAQTTPRRGSPRAEALALFLENLARFRAGTPLVNPVDKVRGY